jgi:hypothetical protein
MALDVLLAAPEAVCLAIAPRPWKAVSNKTCAVFFGVVCVHVGNGERERERVSE